jgi:hypothetical protein
MALGAWRNGVVAVRERWHEHAELGDEGLDQEGMRADDSRSRGQRCGALESVDALLNDGGIASVRSTETTLQGGAACALGGLAGWPLGENIAADGGVLVVNPWQDMRQVVLQGPGETMRGAHVVAHEAAALCDAWCEGTHGGALGLQGRELIALRKQAFELALGGGGGVLGVAGCEGVTIPGARERLDGKAPEVVVLSERVDHGTRVECETDGERVPLASHAPGPHPRLESCWRVRQEAERAWLGARRVQTDLVCGISPVAADERRTFIRR